MLTGTVPNLIAMAVLLALSGFFSGSETALFSLRHEHLRALGRGRGRFVRHLLHDPKSLLITILFGNLLVNVLFYSVSVMLAMNLHASGRTVWATVTGVAAPILVIIFGEVAPKALAVHTPRPIAEFAAPALTLLRAAILPVRVVLGLFTEGVIRLVGPPRRARPVVTPDELKQLLEAGHRRGTLGPHEARMLQELVDLGHLRCHEVMVPRVDVVMCSAASEPAEFLNLVRATGRRRVPVYDGSRDHIVGVADARQVLLHEPAALRECIEPVEFVPESISVEALLKQFRDQHIAMAVVVDEYGGTAGLVTLEDILEEIVGDIAEDPSEAAPAHGGALESLQAIDENTFRVGSRLSIRDWNEHPAFTVELTRTDVDTIGGFVLALLDRLPREGDSVTYANLRFTVERVRRRRIEYLIVEVLPQDAPTQHRRRPAREDQA